MLDCVANEKDNFKQLKYCIELIERIYNAKEIEKDSTIKSNFGDWHSVVTKFFDFIYSRNYITPDDYISDRNINEIWGGEITRTKKKPHVLALWGGDQTTQHISYAENVIFEQQVPGKCSFIEDEYVTNKLVEKNKTISAKEIGKILRHKM